MTTSFNLQNYQFTQFTLKITHCYSDNFQYILYYLFTASNYWTKFILITFCELFTFNLQFYLFLVLFCHLLPFPLYLILYLGSLLDIGIYISSFNYINTHESKTHQSPLLELIKFFKTLFLSRTC